MAPRPYLDARFTISVSMTELLPDGELSHYGRQWRRRRGRVPLDLVFDQRDPKVGAAGLEEVHPLRIDQARLAAVELHHSSVRITEQHVAVLSGALRLRPYEAAV